MGCMGQGKNGSKRKAHQGRGEVMYRLDIFVTRTSSPTFYYFKSLQDVCEAAWLNAHVWAARIYVLKDTHWVSL